MVMETEYNKIEVFQVDSTIVQNVYHTNNNFLIEYDDSAVNNDYCAIYFSSNDIYFPNTEEVFKRRIVEKNYFEWYGTRIKKAWKHIFVRDIFKQWYLKGINSQIYTPELLMKFLAAETKDMKVITIGSSAGGYASLLYGSMLNAERIMAINPQIEVNSLIKRSTASRNPILFRYLDTVVIKYYDLRNIIDINKDNVFYLYSTKSSWDKEQFCHISKYSNMHHIPFYTSHHGIPFLKIALEKTINMENKSLIQFEKKLNNPYLFTMRMVGLYKTFIGIYMQLLSHYKRKKSM